MTRLACFGLILVAMALPTAARANRLPRLHATRGAAPGLFTGDGRQVLLRGVNVNQLGDYFQQSPSLPPTEPLGRADFAAMHRLGFDVVRLLVHWSALEPTRGAFDTRYVARIRRAVHQAAAKGIYVVLDMHQDAWGKFINTPASETCLPPMQRQHGWDGAPQWATITNGLPTCFTNLREAAPAVAAAFQNFYDDTDGIQDELVATWAKLARAFAADPTVAGYDLLNEPNPGTSYPLNDTQSTARFYAAATTAIRAAERSVKRGFSHTVFFEPGVLWSAAGTDELPDPAQITDPNVVFAPHIYAGSIAPISVPQGFDYAQAAAKQYGTTVWSGEWGFFSTNPDDDTANLTTWAAQVDAHLYSDAYWDWKQACGDVHMFADEDQTTPNALSPSLNRYACPDRKALGIPANYRRVLSRAYVRFAPGHLTSLTSDPAARTARLAGADPARRGSCRLEVWVPGARAPTLQATHLRRLKTYRTPGGWTVTACARGTYGLAVS